VSASASTRPLVAATAATTIADRATAPAAVLAPPHAEPLDVLANAELRRVGSTTTRLGLDVATERLGTIRVDAIDRGGELHLNLSSDRATTRNLLAGELSSLRSDLSDGGGSVHVDVGDRHHAAPDRPSITPDDRAVVTSAGPADPLPPPDPTAVAPGRLDLRL
jgi:hypothetical protein